MIVLIDGTAALSGEQLHYAVNPPDNWATTADMRGFQPASRDNVHQIHRFDSGEHQTTGWSRASASGVLQARVLVGEQTCHAARQPHRPCLPPATGHGRS